MGASVVNEERSWLRTVIKGALKMLDVKLQDMKVQDMKMQNMKMYWHILHRHVKHEKQTFVLN